MEGLFLKQGHAVFIQFLLERKLMPRSGGVGSKGDSLACSSQCDIPELREQGCAAGL